MAQQAAQQVEVTHAQGIHFRPAQVIVEVAQQFDSDIVLRQGDRAVDAKEFLPVLELASPKGARLTIEARGHDAEQAVAALAALIGGEFDEESVARLRPGDA
ncbi:MAG: HPr family phosphocarrier protein [Candidatus Brocadiia bacterium]